MVEKRYFGIEKIQEIYNEVKKFVPNNPLLTQGLDSPTESGLLDYVREIGANIQYPQSILDLEGDLNKVNLGADIVKLKSLFLETLNEFLTLGIRDIQNPESLQELRPILSDFLNSSNILNKEEQYGVKERLDLFLRSYGRTSGEFQSYIRYLDWLIDNYRVKESANLTEIMTVTKKLIEATVKQYSIVFDNIFDPNVTDSDAYYERLELYIDAIYRISVVYRRFMTAFGEISI